MAKVPLRTYIHEIETLIDRGNSDEAVAHCRHILKTFPKHLETYRMLGKANLETKHYDQAADIFKRVLMAVPDDFVSHVGMSIINDDRKNLDDTIWHMERAFETQPSNAAIQAELQRLYGRRDGMEPHKIRLTRGALAHMYVQGELYAAAIGEIRSVLAEDPNRIDMQVLLALAYFRSGQKADASDTCSQLLGRSPYCLEANRILVEILPGTGMADNVPTYRGRVVELDPYASYSPGSIFQSEEVADNAVTIERLDFKAQPANAQADWGDLGLGAGSAAASAAQPDWLKQAHEEPTTPPASLRTQPEPAAPAPAAFAAAPDARGESIPDWMRDAGWGASTGAFDESAQPLPDEPSASGEIAKAELPDWIKSMAPASALAPEPAPAAPADDDMDWLNRLGGNAPFAAEQQESAGAPQTPDWLSSLGEPTYAPASQETAGAGALETPDWLSSLDEESNIASEPQKPESAPMQPASWMNEPEPAKVKPMRDTSSEPSKSEPPAPQSAAPSGLGPSIGNLGTSAADQDAAMLWLESLAAKQGAKSEELITNPADRLEKPPEWVEQAQAVSESQAMQPAREEPPVAPAEPLYQEPAPAEPVYQKPAEPLWPKAEDTGRFEPSSEMSATDQTSAWLRNLEEEEDEKPQATVWSGEIEATPPATSPLAEPTPDSDLPAWLRGLDREPVPAQVTAAEDLPNWLKQDEPEPEAEPEPTRPADWMPETPKAAVIVPPEPPRVVEQPKFVQPQRVVEEPQVSAPPIMVSKPAPAPVRVEPVPAPKPTKPAPRKKAEVSGVDRSKLKRTDMLPPLIDPALAQARDDLEHAKIPDALHAYGTLIRRGKFLEEVTFDLKEALYRFPVEVSIWQVLGDAYMRANRLQDALDAYTKAEELLR
jgi:tetratricopeptide (TPR) repeat protein